MKKENVLLSALEKRMQQRDQKIVALQIELSRQLQGQKSTQKGTDKVEAKLNVFEMHSKK
jgi:hypothetical protein